MAGWQQALKYDPLDRLLSGRDETAGIFARRDLLEEKVEPDLAQLSEVRSLLKKQQADGSWIYPGRQAAIFPPHHYPLVETWKRLRLLVEKYQMSRHHPQVAAGCEYILSCQTAEGDIRGMIGNQHATYYTGAMLSLLNQAGYLGDERVNRGILWLLGMRQEDGGWTIPMLTYKLDRRQQYRLTTTECPPLEPDRSRPFSHNWTGMVLRGLATHPLYARSSEARHAGRLLKSRFFKKDVYSSYRSEQYWMRFQFPFWWNSLLSAMVSLHQVGFEASEEEIGLGIEWFVEHQQVDGLWPLSAGKPDNGLSMRQQGEQSWVGLAICRMLKSYLG